MWQKLECLKTSAIWLNYQFFKGWGIYSLAQTLQWTLPFSWDCSFPTWQFHPQKRNPLVKFPMQSQRSRNAPKILSPLGTLQTSLDLAWCLGRMDKMVKQLEVTFQVFGNERWYIWELSYNQRQTPTQWIKGRIDGGGMISATGIAKQFSDDRFKMQITKKGPITRQGSRNK